MENVEFECATSLQDNSDFQSHASSILTHLMDLAPSDSNMTAGLEQKENGFLASVSIASFSGRFESQALSSDPFRAMSTVQGETREQLSRWKSTRE
jgi:hypothetical protein